MAEQLHNRFLSSTPADTESGDMAESGIAVYPRCIRVALGADEVLDFEKELMQELSQAEQTYQRNGEVWLGDVRLGCLPIVTSKGERLVLVSRDGSSVRCYSLEQKNIGAQVDVDSNEVTDLLLRMFFFDFKATLWCWAQECIRKLTGLQRRCSFNLSWKQALLGQELEQHWMQQQHSDVMHVWHLLRRCILTEIWWLYNRSLVEDTSRVTARYLVQQVWLALRLHIILEWMQVVKVRERLIEGSADNLAAQFERRWLFNGFAGMKTTSWVLWLWEEPVLISKLCNY